MGSYSVGKCIRLLIGQPFYCSAANAGMWGERGYGDGSTPMHDWAVSPYFHGCLAFLHRHFPPQSPSHPLDPSLCSQQWPLPWDCSTTPKLQLPAAAASRGPVSLSGVCMAARGLSDSHSFYAATDQLFYSQPELCLLWLRQLPQCGDRTPAFVSLPTKGRSSPTNTSVFPLVPSSYWVLHGSLYFSPLVRYSRPLSVGVLHALLCLKVYSWCIHE